MKFLFYLLSYLIGSISFSYIVVKLYSGEDVRDKGSNNAGTTNVLRNYGWWLGIATYALDSIKGMICAYLAKLWEFSPIIAVSFAVIGHIFPFYMKFRGGKGVATISGGFTFLYPKLFPVGLLVFLATFFLTKIMSLASMALMAYLAIVFIFVLKLQGYDLFFSLLTVALVVFMHRNNIKRLLQGKENKIVIGGKK